jgi:plastocyanin
VHTTTAHKTRGVTAVLACLGIAVLAVLPAPAAPAPAAVVVEGFAFKPDVLEIKVGTKVVWTNNDDAGHTVTSGTPDNRTNLFSQPLDGKGARFEFTFPQAGTIQYFCLRHQRMRGRVIVKD